VMSISATLANLGDCVDGPDEFREVYGIQDTVLHFPMGPGDDTTWPVKFWRDHFGCSDVGVSSTYNITGERAYDRTHWTCDDQSVTFDLHQGGHLIPRGWIGQQLDELLGRTPTFP